MANDYNTLLSKYNRLVSRFNDLQTQVEEKQQKWKAIETAYKKNEASARGLCEQILAKNPDEMVLGVEYSWSKIDTATLLSKARTSFSTYNEGRTKLLKQIQATAEERRLQIDSLILQLAHKIQDGRMSPSPAAVQEVKYNKHTGEVIEDTVATQMAAPPTSEVEKVLKKAPYKIQEAAKSGAISVVIMEDDEDVSYADIAQQADMARLSEVVSIDKQGIKVSPAAKKRVAMEQARKKQAEVMMMDIEPVRARMDDRKWLIVEVIGTHGYCERASIQSEFDKLFLARELGKNKLSDGAFAYILKSLIDSNVLLLDNTVQHPIKSQFAVYYLSDVGKRFYEQQFKKPPIISERDLLVSQHDNLEHAFGIKSLKEILESSGEYTSVCMDRVQNTISMKDGSQYIPDIIAICHPKGRPNAFKVFMEYERDTHHQADFNIKLNKMAKNTRFLNIVAPNAAAAKGLAEKVNKWIASRGIQSLRSIKVRITSIKRLMDAVSDGVSINDDKAWYATYNLSSGPDPVLR